MTRSCLFLQLRTFSSSKTLDLARSCFVPCIYAEAQDRGNLCFSVTMASPIEPALPPPPGIVSNFLNPDDLGPHLVSCTITLTVIGCLLVTARIVSRTVLTSWRLGWDDCESASLKIWAAQCRLTCAEMSWYWPWSVGRTHREKSTVLT